MRYAALSSAAFSALDKRDLVALLPVGTLEQHGPHLPLSTDTDIAAGLAAAVERLRPEGPGAILLLPAVPYGVSSYPLDPPGGIRVAPRHFEGLVEDIIEGVFAQGLRLAFIVNGHAGNTPHLTIVQKIVNERHGGRALVGTTVLYLSGPRGQQALSACGFSAGIRHADEVETSLLLALAPETVDLSAARDDEGRFRTPRYQPYDDGPLKLYLSFAAESREGVYGCPSRATAQAGAHLLAEAAQELLEMIDDMRGIYQALSA
jgi:creatinine amidohydrolase